MKLFKRNVRVTIGRANEPGRSWRELRTSFKIERTPSGTPANSGDFTIFNLNGDSRGFIEKGMKIRLETSYNEEPLVPAFVGDVKKFEHKREGVDWLTTIEAGDGHKAISEAAIFASLGPGSSPEQVLKALKDSMKGVDISEGFTGALNSIAQKTQGITLQGRTADELDQLLEPQGLEWSIQDEVLQVVKVGEATTEPVLVLTPSTGLVSARRLEDGKLEVIAYMAPGLRPRRRVKVVGEEVQGVFIVEKVRHNGDTHGKPWFTTAECI